MSRPVILIVDDVADTRASLGKLLELRGYHVLEAEHGAQALDLLRAHPETALVLLDLFMPTLDGWKFREQQLRDPDIGHVPVVVLSVATRTELVKYPLRAQAVLHKPPSADDILAAVNDCCGPDSVIAREQKAKWAAGFLGGRVRAFAKGNVPHADLLAAIRLAQRHGVPAGVIDTTLAAHKLSWNPLADAVEGGE